MADPKSVGDILRGDGSNAGFRHITSGGASITDGPTSDPNWPGGRYTSITDTDGFKRTIVHDNSGNIVKDSGWQKK